MEIPIRLDAIGRKDDTYYLLFEEVGGPRKLCLQFSEDYYRYIAYARQIRGEQKERFLHGFVASLMTELGVVLESVRIGGEVEDRYRMFMHLRHGHLQWVRELMPSDAIALACATKCRLVINEPFLDLAHARYLEVSHAFFSIKPGESREQALASKLAQDPSDETLPKA